MARSLDPAYVHPPTSPQARRPDTIAGSDNRAMHFIKDLPDLPHRRRRFESPTAEKAVKRWTATRRAPGRWEDSDQTVAPCASPGIGRLRMASAVSPSWYFRPPGLCDGARGVTRGPQRSSPWRVPAAQARKTAESAFAEQRKLLSNAIPGLVNAHLIFGQPAVSGGRAVEVEPDSAAPLVWWARRWPGVSW